MTDEILRGKLYELQPGPELDGVIHSTIMNQKIDYGRTYRVSKEEIIVSSLQPVIGPACLCGSRSAWGAVRPRKNS